MHTVFIPRRSLSAALLATSGLLLTPLAQASGFTEDSSAKLSTSASRHPTMPALALAGTAQLSAASDAVVPRSRLAWQENNTNKHKPDIKVREIT